MSLTSYEANLDRYVLLTLPLSLLSERRLYERLLESFEDDWNDREFFRRYSG